MRSSQAIIAIEGGYGTLSEIGIALKLRKPVVGLRTWVISKKIVTVETPKDAVKKAISLISRSL